MAKVVQAVTGEDLFVQGFRGGPGADDKPYVFIGVPDEDYGMLEIVSLDARNAHVLSEFIRSEAEFAASGEQEEVVNG